MTSASPEPRLGHANLGFGVGLRHVHFPYLLDRSPPVDWFEMSAVIVPSLAAASMNVFQAVSSVVSADRLTPVAKPTPPVPSVAVGS